MDRITGSPYLYWNDKGYIVGAPTATDIAIQDGIACICPNQWAGDLKNHIHLTRSHGITKINTSIFEEVEVVA